MQKPMLTPEQLVAKMRDEKGITFLRMDEAQAAAFLRERNNYFRLASYRKNYDKYLKGTHKGKYIQLDFSELVELSIIDMHLRFILTRMCGDVEHVLKVKLMADIAANENEDGYSIVLEFLEDKRWLTEGFFYERRSTYVGDLIDKYFSFDTYKDIAGKVYFERIEIDCPVWAFLEIISFGVFLDFYEFYYTAHPSCPSEKRMTGELRAVKSLRNACAHNNCIISNLRKGYSTPSYAVKQFVKQIPGIGKDSADSKLSVRPMLEVACLLYVYEQVVTPAIKGHRYEELQNLTHDRMLKHKDYFQNQVIISTYNFFQKVVDFLT